MNPKTPSNLNSNSQLPMLSVAKLIRQKRLKKMGKSVGNLPPTLPTNLEASHLSWNHTYNAPENYSFNWISFCLFFSSPVLQKCEWIDWWIKMKLVISSSCHHIWLPFCLSFLMSKYRLKPFSRWINRIVFLIENRA